MKKKEGAASFYYGKIKDAAQDDYGTEGILFCEGFGGTGQGFRHCQGGGYARFNAAEKRRGFADEAGRNDRWHGRGRPLGSRNREALQEDPVYKRENTYIQKL